ncbi:hypothetical protein QTG54_014064 [Skeletonema marinoi]|uniref:Uncharacterized protein n=1 Tax=Skeletonema marinoi TaxID=267567 RepID=A0AAD9D774_9STRA|nr:hypothetical protein QTG54_014064 [Skeletonema marinoi]
MNIYTVLILFAAMLFLGSDQVYGSNLHPGARDGTLETGAGAQLEYNNNSKCGPPQLTPSYQEENKDQVLRM